MDPWEHAKFYSRPVIFSQLALERTSALSTHVVRILGVIHLAVQLPKGTKGGCESHTMARAQVRSPGGAKGTRSPYNLCLLESSLEEYQRRRFSFSIACAVEAATVALIAISGAWFSNPRLKPIYDVETISFPHERQIDQTLSPLSNVGLPKTESAKSLKPSLAPPIFTRALPASAERKVAPPRNEDAATQLPRTSQLARRDAPISPPGHAVEETDSTQLREHPLTTIAPLSNRETGAFSSPEFLTGQIQPAKPANELKLGEFGSPDGDANSGPPNGSQPSARTVADAGFGTGDQYGEQYNVTDIDETDTRRVLKGGFGDGRDEDGANPASKPLVPSAVKTGGFVAAEDASISPSMPSPRQQPEPEVQAVEILSKVLPQYTDEARRLHIQGDVILSVVFQAGGTVKVLGIVKSLGHGLDEAAEQAALKIRFKPATRAGKPLDFPATLHVEFRQG